MRDWIETKEWKKKRKKKERERQKAKNCFFFGKTDRSDKPDNCFRLDRTFENLYVHVLHVRSYTCIKHIPWPQERRSMDRTFLPTRAERNRSNGSSFRYRWRVYVCMCVSRTLSFKRVTSWQLSYRTLINDSFLRGPKGRRTSAKAKWKTIFLPPFTLYPRGSISYIQILEN